MTDWILGPVSAPLPTVVNDNWAFELGPVSRPGVADFSTYSDAPDVDCFATFKDELSVGGFVTSKFPAVKVVRVVLCSIVVEDAEVAIPSAAVVFDSNWTKRSKRITLI